MQAQSRCIQGWMPIVGEGTAYRQTVSTDHFGLVISAHLQCSFDRTNPTHLFFEFFLGMPISFSHRLRRFAEVMEVTQLMRNIGQGMGNRFANGVLSIGNDAFDGNL